MYNVLIYGLGKVYDDYVNLLKAGELLGKLYIKGVTGANSIYECVDGYPFIPAEEIKWSDYDVFVIAADIERTSYAEIKKKLINNGVPDERIIPISAFSVPNFNLEKYIKIHDVSIIASNCWGGFTYHKLKMQFRSPFINMFMNQYEFIKILKNLEWYMEQPVTFSYWADGVHGGKYPVGRLADVLLHFKHASNFEDALGNWNRRKERINYNNIFAMMFTERRDVAELFAELPYNKICFTTFEDTNIECVHYCEGIGKEYTLNTLVNSMAQGIVKDYDVFDLLLGINNYRRIGI